MKACYWLVALLALAACKKADAPADGGLLLVPVPAVALETFEPPLRARLDACVAAVRAAPNDAAAWGQLGMVYDAHDLAAEALQCYERAAALAPAAPRWPYLAATVLDTTDKAGARRQYDAAEARGSQHPPLFVRRGLGMLQAGELDGARADLQRATELDPGLAAAWLGLARVALASDDLAAARTALIRAEALALTTGEVHGLWAELLRREGAVDEAQRRMARVSDSGARELLPDSERMAVGDEGVTLAWTRRRAAAATARGDVASALAVWQAAERSAPDDVATRLGVSDLLQRLGRLDEAEAHLTGTEELLARGAAPKALAAEAALQRGLTELARGRTEAAAARFASASELDPSSHVARANLGLARVLSGDVEAGVDLVLAATTASGSGSRVRERTLDTLAAARRWPELQALTERLLERTPDDAYLQHTLGLAHAGRGEFDAAVAAFRRAAALAPELESAPLNEARAHLNLGAEAAAATALRSARERLPESRVLAQRLAWLLATAADPAVVDGAAAVLLARQVLAAAPKSPEYLELAAAAFAAAGEQVPAVTHQELALEFLAAIPEHLAPPKREALAELMRRRLAEYRAGRRWIERGP